MSDTHELSSPLPALAATHACMDLHSKPAHLNTGETILRLALWNSPQSVCVHCVFSLSAWVSISHSLPPLPLPFLPLNSVVFCILGAYGTCGSQADSVFFSAVLCLSGFLESGSGFSILHFYIMSEHRCVTPCFSKSWRQMMRGLRCEATSVFMVPKDPDLPDILEHESWCQPSEWVRTLWKNATQTCT